MLGLFKSNVGIPLCTHSPAGRQPPVIQMPSLARRCNICPRMLDCPSKSPVSIQSIMCCELFCLAHHVASRSNCLRGFHRCRSGREVTCWAIEAMAGCARHEPQQPISDEKRANRRGDLDGRRSEGKSKWETGGEVGSWALLNVAGLRSKVTLTPGTKILRPPAICRPISSRPQAQQTQTVGCASPFLCSPNHPAIVIALCCVE
jgi:hypothetical protein